MMMTKPTLQQLGRRDFMKALAGGLFSLSALPAAGPTRKPWLGPAIPWPDMGWPAPIQETLDLIQPATIDSAGYFNLVSRLNDMPVQGRIELLETKWNLKHFSPWYRLRHDLPWALVLHWDGGPNYPRSLAQLVDGLNHSENIVTKTEAENSAHFGVGPAKPCIARGDYQAPLSIAQLQRPWNDGTPLLASHLRYTVGNQDQRQGTPGQVLYLMRDLGIRSSLVDIHLGQRLDPNFRTLAIEINGRKFDDDYPNQLPGTQLMANLLTLVQTLMLRYNLRAWDVIGHLELQADKPDPGKLFLAYVRFMLGVLATQDSAPGFRQLVFGPYYTQPQLAQQAHQYFSQLDLFTRRITTTEQYQLWNQHTQCRALADRFGEAGLAPASPDRAGGFKA
jgi:hypothetical protein